MHEEFDIDHHSSHHGHSRSYRPPSRPRQGSSRHHERPPEPHRYSEPGGHHRTSHRSSHIPHARSDSRHKKPQSRNERANDLPPPLNDSALKYATDHEIPAQALNRVMWYISLEELDQAMIHFANRDQKRAERVIRHAYKRHPDGDCATIEEEALFGRLMTQIYQFGRDTTPTSLRQLVTLWQDQGRGDRREEALRLFVSDLKRLTSHPKHQSTPQYQYGGTRTNNDDIAWSGDEVSRQSNRRQTSHHNDTSGSVHRRLHRAYGHLEEEEVHLSNRDVKNAFRNAVAQGEVVKAKERYMRHRRSHRGYGSDGDSDGY